MTAVLVRSCPRGLRPLLALVAGLCLLSVTAPGAGAQQISLVAGGDVEWSRAVKPPPAYLLHGERKEVLRIRGEARSVPWSVVPLLNRSRARDSIRARLAVEELDSPGSHHRRAIIYPLEFESEEDEMRYPLRGVRSIVRDADIAFANLEMPLSDRARHTGAFLGRTAFADALRWAGFDVVSIANNHAFDGEERGLLDTKAALERAGVGAVGGGKNLEDARRPHIVEVDGVSMAFLGYTWAVNVVGSWGFPAPDRSGVMPLDPLLIEEDIARVRDRVDHVVLSFHWSVENAQETHPDARAFAQRMIDAGADVILGHHPHVPRGVEVYGDGVIFYSFGNLIFGHNHTYWGDNYLARLTLDREGVTEIEILPVSGRGNDMSQPRPLEGVRAQAVLERVRELSAELDTRLEIAGDVGVVRP